MGQAAWACRDQCTLSMSVTCARCALDLAMCAQCTRSDLVQCTVSCTVQVTVCITVLGHCSRALFIG